MDLCFYDDQERKSHDIAGSHVWTHTRNRRHFEVDIITTTIHNYNLQCRTHLLLLTMHLPHPSR